LTSTIENCNVYRTFETFLICSLMRYIFSFIFIASCFSIFAQDSSYNARAIEYAKQFASLAIEEQQRAGIPAAVTLAQGIIETDAGTSELMLKANNHFGIKCKSDWKGETFLHTDDHPNECFKKYKSVEESYKDHSDHLHRNPRYAKLFKVSVENYQGWSKGLKECGYATCTTYAEKLIKAIEDYQLEQYTVAALDIKPITTKSVTAVAANDDDSEEDSTADVEPVLVNQSLPIVKVKIPDSVKSITTTKDNIVVVQSFDPNKDRADDSLNKIRNAPPIPPTAPDHSLSLVDSAKTKPYQEPEPEDKKYDRGNTITYNGLKAFYVHKGESLLTYAVQYNVRYSHLLEMNDLPDAPAPANMLIYLEKKLAQGVKEKHVVKDHETLVTIAQEESIQMAKLKEYNMLDEGDDPEVGADLELQYPATHKPGLKGMPKDNQAENMSINFLKEDKNAKPADYVATVKPKPADTVAKIAPEISVPVSKPALRKEPVNETPIAANNTKPAINQLPAEPKNEIKPIDSIKLTTDFDGGDEEDATASKPEHKPTVKPVHKAPAAVSKYYKVQKGDTPTSIAHKNNITIKQLMRWNDISPRDLRPGQKLQVKE